MTDSSRRKRTPRIDILPPTAAGDSAVQAGLPAPVPTPAGLAALAAAQQFARAASAKATVRAYKANWAHFSTWCDAHGFVAIPAAPAVVGAYLGSLAGSHAPSTIRRRLAAIGKLHRYNDLPWNPGHSEIQGPLQGVLRLHGQPPCQARALSLPLLRRLLASCDASARPARPRPAAVRLRRRAAAVLAGGAAGGRRVAHARRPAPAPQQDRPGGAGGGTRATPRAVAGNCPVRAFEAWQAVAKRKAGPLFRKISTGGTIGDKALHPGAVGRILATRAQLAGLKVEDCERLSAHALRVGFITEAYSKVVRDADIMRHTRHRDLRSMRGYVRRAGLLSDSPAGMLDL